MCKIKMVLAAGAGLLLAACTASPSMSKDFGVSTRQNLTYQALDAKAGERDLLPPTLDGIKAEKAVERYRKDKPEDSRATLVDEK